MVVLGSSAGERPVDPDLLGRYQLVLPIAAGGMATVYLAKSKGTGGFERYVAIKLTHPHLESAEGELMADLLEEAKLAVRIRHPNIVPTLDVGEAGRSLFLVMDYVEGDSLSGLVRKARRAGEELPLGMTMRILCDSLAGLHAAHELKDEDGRLLEVVHRDVSPQNIIVGTDGMARLADFGIARAASRVSQTRPGAVKGKVAYMPPEQIQGKEVDRRCDVWASGVVAWELLARRRFFDRGDDIAVAVQVVAEPVPDLFAARADVPPALERAVRGALMKERAQRTPTAAAFRAALLEACKASGITLFDHDEVGTIVTRLTREMLETRHRQAKELISKRLAAVGTPLPIPPAPNSHPQTELVPLAAVGQPGPEGTSIVPTQRTDTSAVRDRLGGPRRDRTLAFVGAGAALFVVAIAASYAITKKDDSPTGAASATALSETASARPRGPDVVVPVPTSVSTSAAPVATSSEPPSEPAVSSAPSARPTLSSTSTTKRPARTASPLATSPYGGKK